MYANVSGFDIQAVGTLINLDDAAAQYNILYTPAPITIIQFGAVVTEAFVTSVGSFTLSLAYSEAAEWDDPSPDSATVVATITPTLASGAAIGNLLIYDGTALPFAVANRRIVYTQNVDGGTTVAGSVRPFIIYRIDGVYDAKGSNVFNFSA